MKASATPRGRRMWPQASPSPPTPRDEGVLGVWGGGEGVQELGGIQAQGWLKAQARGGGWSAEEQA